MSPPRVGVRAGLHLFSLPACPQQAACLRALFSLSAREVRIHAMGLLGIWALSMRFQSARCLCCVGCAMGHPCPPTPPPAHRLSYTLMEMPLCYQGGNRRHLRTHIGSPTVGAFPDYRLQNVPHLCLPMSPGHLAGGLLDQPLSCSFSASLLGLLKFSLCQVEINGDCHGNAFSVTTVCIWPSHPGTRNDSSYKIPFGLSRSSTFSAERSQPFIVCTGPWVQAPAGHRGNGSSLPHVPGARPEGVEGELGSREGSLAPRRGAWCWLLAGKT